MVGSKDSETVEDQVLAAEEQWRLARRSDLGDAFGIVLILPEHGQDEQGTWRYGLRPMYGWANEEVSDQFESEMRELVSDTASSLVSRGFLTPKQAASIRPHPYSVGPAAQEWPKIFLDLYQDARPFLSDGASILAWGYFFKDVIKAIWSWASKKEQEQSEYPEAESVVYSGISAIPGIVLTRPALVALCYTDLVDRHSVTGDVIIGTYPRSFTEYATPDHPGGQESYLIRARCGRRTFFYHANGTGEVAEHYSVVGSTLTLLPLPNFTGEQAPYQTRQALPSQQMKIEGD